MGPDGVLGHALARRIVERAMQRLGHNVNVMDAEGVIVGSGESERVGEVHEGALLAIRGGRTVVVDDAMAERIAGVRPGVNLPLVVAGRTVGAIGVTGDPVVLAPVAEVLRMAAELMVEQAAAADDEQWRSQRLDTLAGDMVTPHVDEDALTAHAEGLDVDVTVPRRVFLVVPGPGRGEVDVRAARRAVHRGGLDVVTRMEDPEILLLLVSAGATVSDVVRRLGPGGAHVELVVGGAFGSGVPGDGLAAAHASAHDVLRAARPDAGARPAVRAWDDDRLTALVVGLPDDWRLQALTEPWERLAGEELLVETVVAYLESGADLARTAVRLRVHRNTLRHRLERVAAASGVDVRDPYGAMPLLVGAIRAGRLCMRTAEVPPN